jgi:hypothetical protein
MCLQQEAVEMVAVLVEIWALTEVLVLRLRIHYYLLNLVQTVMAVVVVVEQTTAQEMVALAQVLVLALVVMVVMVLEVLQMLAMLHQVTEQAVAVVLQLNLYQQMAAQVHLELFIF